MSLRSCSRICHYLAKAGCGVLPTVGVCSTGCKGRPRTLAPPVVTLRMRPALCNNLPQDRVPAAVTCLSLGSRGSLSPAITCLAEDSVLSG